MNFVVISMNRWLGVAAHQSLAAEQEFRRLRAWIVDVLVLVDTESSKDKDSAAVDSLGALEWRRAVRRAIAAAPAATVASDFEIGQHMALLLDLASKANVSEMDPTLLWLLSMQLRSFDVDKSNDLLQRAQRKHVDNFLVNRSLGHQMMEERRLTDAIRYLSAAVVARPHGHTFADLGRLLEMVESTDDALAMFENGIQLNPKHPIANRDCIEFLCRQGKYKLAREKLDAALSPSGVPAKSNERWTLVMLSSYVYEHGERDLVKACDVLTNFIESGHYPVAVRRTMEDRVDDLLFVE